MDVLINYMRGNPFTLLIYTKSPRCILQIFYNFMCKLYLLDNAVFFKGKKGKGHTFEKE